MTAHVSELERAQARAIANASFNDLHTKGIAVILAEARDAYIRDTQALIRSRNGPHPFGLRSDRKAQERQLLIGLLTSGDSPYAETDRGTADIYAPALPCDSERLK